MERLGRQPRAARRPLLPPARSVALVAVGGAIGTAARYGVNRPFPVRAGELPMATFGENVVGAALLGLVVAILASRPTPSPGLRLLLATGTLGAFTTFSTLATEVVLLTRDSRVGLAFAYALATLAAGLAAAAAAMCLGGRFSARRQGPSGTGGELMPEDDRKR